jgi:hypothetical protein
MENQQAEELKEERLNYQNQPTKDWNTRLAKQQRLIRTIKAEKVTGINF